MIDGDPRDVLPRAAADRRADLIVVGSLGAGTVKKDLGPVAAHLGTNATIPVAVIR